MIDAGYTRTGQCDICGNSFEYKPFFTVQGRELKRHQCDSCRSRKSLQNSNNPIIIKDDSIKHESDIELCVACVDWLQHNGHPRMNYGDFVAQYDTQVKRHKFALDHDVRRRDGSKVTVKRRQLHGIRK